MSYDHPPIMESNPTPRIVTRLYYGKNVQMWEGKVKTQKIEGWAENPRITLARERWERDYGRPPDQNEVFEIMKTESDIKLGVLRNNIMRNGLREPLVLTFNGRLLDGNRRFFAIRDAIDKLKPDDPRRGELEKINAYVLTEDSEEEEKQHILIEENFAPSLKLEWPDYVKANHIRNFRNEGKSEEEIAIHFGWDKSKVRETIRTLGVIDDFIAYAINEPDPDTEGEGTLHLNQTQADDYVSKRYQFFNEAQKSFLKPLEQDVDFKIQFFRWLHKGCFKSFPQVRIAHKAYQNQEAKSILDSDDSDAGKNAKTVVDDEARVITDARGAANKIRTFVKFLNNLKSQNIGNLPTSVLEDLRQALEMVETMARSVSKDGDEPPE